MTLHRLPTVHRLLIALCHRDAVTRVPDSDVALLRDPTLWADFVWLAQSHRVHGLALTVLERINARPSLARNALPAERLIPLKTLRRQALGWDMEQARVLARLEKRGVIPVVLKGSALRRLVYSESAQRPLSDLDLLVTREAMDASRAALTELGYFDPNSELQNEIYVEFHFHQQMQHAGGFMVELHWALTLPGPNAQIDPAQVMQQARSVPGATGSFLAPRAEHMVLHLASQCLDDTFGNVGRIVDIDRVIASAGDAFDWELLSSAAVRGHLGAATGVALRLAELLFDTPVPERFVRDLKVQPVTRANLAALRPVAWILEHRGQRFSSAGLAMRAWLLAAPGARRDLALKLFRLRSDPIPLLGHHDAHDAAALKDTRMSVNWIPPFLKFAGYQFIVWFSALGALLSTKGRDEIKFWTREGGAHGTR